MNAVATTVGTNLACSQRAVHWIFVVYSRPARNQCCPALSQIMWPLFTHPSTASGLHNSPECQGRRGHAHGHTRSSYEQHSALTSQFSHCQDWKYQPLTLRLSSPNMPQPHPGFQEEQRQINQASDQWNRLQCVQRRSAEVHKLGRRRATNSLSNVSPVQCSVNSPHTAPRPPWLHSQGCGLPGPHAKLSLVVVLPPSSELWASQPNLTPVIAY